MLQIYTNKFLINQNKEQELFLCGYTFFCGCACWVFFGLYPLSFTVGIFCFSFCVYAFFTVLIKKFQGSDLLFFITLLSLLFLVTISLIYAKYLLTLIIFLVVTVSWLKRKYIPIITKDIKLESFSKAQRFFIDFAVIDYHFETEFRIIGLFKDVNMVATVIFFRLALLMFAQANGNSTIEFEIERTFMIALFYWLTFNHLVIFLTRHLIVQYCNPPMGYINFQKLFGYAGPLGIGVLNVLGFHTITTSGFVDPLPLRFSDVYQHYVLGYTFHTRYEAALAQVYIFTHKGALPPLNMDHSVNVQAVQEILSKMSDDQIKRVVAATAYIIRPDVDILLNGLKEPTPAKTEPLDIRK